MIESLCERPGNIVTTGIGRTLWQKQSDGMNNRYEHQVQLTTKRYRKTQNDRDKISQPMKTQLNIREKPRREQKEHTGEIYIEHLPRKV